MTETTTQETLHKILRCVHSGDVVRKQVPNGTWRVDINDHKIPPERVDEIRLGLSVLEAQGLIKWTPKHTPQQSAKRTRRGVHRLREWDHANLFNEHQPLNLDLLNDAAWDGGDGDTAA